MNSISTSHSSIDSEKSKRIEAVMLWC